MARLFSKGFYNSKEWLKVRELYKQSRHGICERCGKPNGSIVHHKVYLNENNINDANITLNFENLELLCIECHNREHLKLSSVANGLKFDMNGKLCNI